LTPGFADSAITISATGLPSLTKSTELDITGKGKRRNTERKTLFMILPFFRFVEMQTAFHAYDYITEMS
jgi:hypothetical protein